MLLEFRSNRTATGKSELIARGECKWHEFPRRAQAVVDHFRMVVTNKIEVWTNGCGSRASATHSSAEGYRDLSDESHRCGMLTVKRKFDPLLKNHCCPRCNKTGSLGVNWYTMIGGDPRVEKMLR